VTVDVKVPVLAESISEATLLEWKKQEGEAVERDEILIEIETDKVVLEVPAPESGVLKEIVKGDGETVESDEVIARVDTDGAAAGDGEGKEHKEAKKQEKEDEGEDEDEDEGEDEDEDKDEDEDDEAAGGDGERMGPAARKLIAEHDLDPARIDGTGKDGRITKGDVLAYLEEKEDEAGKKEERKEEAGEKAAPRKEEAAAAKGEAPARAPAAVRERTGGERTERREPMSRLRQRVAERLVQAQQTAAILTTFNEVDMQPVMALRGRHKETFEKTHGVRLGFMSFFVKAAVKALKAYPAVNAYIEGKEIVYHDFYDIGIAVGSPRGLLVPILRDADLLSFAGIEAAITDFGQRAQKGQIDLDELTGGTFTISNGGVFGSLLSTPILNPPQSGILGMHKTMERPMVANGEVVVRPMMYLAFSYDHRIIDGREAVRFLVTIKEAIEDPGRMLLDV